MKLPRIHLFEFEDQPYFAGFRSLASNGIDKPVLNVFRMFAKMRGQRLAAESSGALPLDEIVRRGVRGQPDVGAVASVDGKRVWVMTWHYHDDDVPGPEASIEMQFTGLGLGNADSMVRHYRIDQDHSNAFTAWKKMGSPQQPTREQYAELEKAGQLALLNESATRVEQSQTIIRFMLPRQAVSLIELSF